MVLKAPCASSVKGKKADSTKAKRASKPRTKRASKATKPTGVQKSTIPKLPELPKRMTKKKIIQNLNEGILEARVDMEVDELPSTYRVTENDANFVPRSEANLTWGSVSNEGVKAIVLGRRRGGLSELKRKKQAGEVLAKKARTMQDGTAGGIVVDDDVDSDAEDDVLEVSRLAMEEEERLAKFGGRCFFTELPKEIRGEIYGWLLVMEQPIFVHCNWTAVQRMAGVKFDINLLRIENHVIHHEATEYFYRHNTFYGLVRCANPNWRHPDNIKARFIRNFRDVVVEATEKNVFVDPEDLRMFDTLDALRSADCLLNSLVLVLSPYTIQNAVAQNALLGVVPNASRVAYVDWFKKGSKVHKVLGLLNKYGLRYRELFVVLKLTAGGQDGKVVIRIDTAGLPQNFEVEQIIGKWEVIKDRIIKEGEKAKKEVEQVADNIEKLTRWANSGLSWDTIRVKVAEYEKLRLEQGVEDISRMRLLGEKESVEGLKWWTREAKAEKRAADTRKVTGMMATATQFDAAASEQQPVQDVQPTFTEQAGDNSTSATPSAAASFEDLLGESMMAAAWRAHKHRLAEFAAAGQNPYAPGPEPAVETETAFASPPATGLATVTVSASVTHPQPEPLPSAAPFSLQSVFNAGAGSPMVPGFQDLVEVLSGSRSAPLLDGESGEVDSTSSSDVEVLADGKPPEEKAAGEVWEDMFADSGEEPVVEEEALFLPHTLVTPEEYDTQMIDVDGMFHDTEREVMSAFGEREAAGEEEIFFPDTNLTTLIEEHRVDTHMAEGGMTSVGIGSLDCVEDVGKDAEGDGMLDVLEAEMVAALEQDMAADGNVDDIFDPDGAKI